MGGVAAQCVALTRSAQCLALGRLLLASLGPADQGCADAERTQRRGGPQSWPVPGGDWSRGAGLGAIMAVALMAVRMAVRVVVRAAARAVLRRERLGVARVAAHTWAGERSMSPTSASRIRRA